MSVWNSKNSIALKIEHNEEIEKLKVQYEQQLKTLEANYKKKLLEAERKLVTVEQGYEKKLSILEQKLEGADEDGIEVLNTYLNRVFDKIFVYSLEGNKIVRISLVIQEIMGFTIDQSILIKDLGVYIAKYFGPTLNYCTIIKNGEVICIREYTRRDLKRLIYYCNIWYEANKENTHLIIEGAKAFITEIVTIDNIPVITDIILQYLY